METWSKRMDIAAVGKQFGTPLHVVNPARIAENFAGYKALVGEPKRVVFPIKANPSMAVLRVLSKLGSSALVASSQEFYLARLADFQPEDIYYYSPALDMRRSIGLLNEGGTVILDSVEDITRLQEAMPEGMDDKPVWLRINSALPLPAETVSRINLPGHSNKGAAKFGIPAEEILPALKAARINISGLHFHAGPQVDNVEVFVAVLTYLHELIDQIHGETSHRIGHLNIGGGLGIPFSTQERFPSIADYVAALQPLLRGDITYMVEPGRGLVGDAAGIITKVENVKSAGGQRWGIVDMGSRDLDRVAMSRLPQQIIDGSGNALALDGPDTLCGPLCFADDTLLAKTSLTGVKAGDYLMIQHCGAYCYTVARQFDGRAMQGAVNLEDSGEPTRTAIVEDEVLNPTYSTFLWESDAPNWDTPQEVDPALVKVLNSRYLQYLSAEDSYEIHKTTQLSDNAFLLELDVKSPVDFISLPFCIRMAADLAIMAALKLFGEKEKLYPVWADRLYLDASVNMKPNRIVPLELSFSPFAGKGTNKVTNVRFAMDGGRFSGFMRLKFNTADLY